MDPKKNSITIKNVISKNQGEAFACYHLYLQKGHNSATKRVLKIQEAY